MTHQVENVVVRNGALSIDRLPFGDGTVVRVTVSAEVPEARPTIQEVQDRLRGSVLRYDDPFEPAIPVEEWEAMK